MRAAGCMGKLEQNAVSILLCMWEKENVITLERVSGEVWSHVQRRHCHRACLVFGRYNNIIVSA